MSLTLDSTTLHFIESIAVLLQQKRRRKKRLRTQMHALSLLAYCFCCGQKLHRFFSFLTYLTDGDLFPLFWQLNFDSRKGLSRLVAISVPPLGHILGASLVGYHVKIQYRV
jgi:hypothetical protein